MGALKFQETKIATTRKSTLPAQPDYSDEITQEQIEAARKQVSQLLDDDEWIIVDGPAW